MRDELPNPNELLDSILMRLIDMDERSRLTQKAVDDVRQEMNLSALRTRREFNLLKEEVQVPEPTNSEETRASRETKRPSFLLSNFGRSQPSTDQSSPTRPSFMTARQGSMTPKLKGNIFDRTPAALRFAAPTPEPNKRRYSSVLDQADMMSDQKRMMIAVQPDISPLKVDKPIFQVAKLVKFITRVQQFNTVHATEVQYYQLLGPSYRETLCLYVGADDAMFLTGCSNADVLTAMSILITPSHSVEFLGKLHEALATKNYKLNKAFDWDCSYLEAMEFVQDAMLYTRDFLDYCKLLLQNVEDVESIILDTDKDGGLAEEFIKILPPTFRRNIKRIATLRQKQADKRCVQFYAELLEEQLIQFKAYAKERQSIRANFEGVSAAVSTSKDARGPSDTSTAKRAFYDKRKAQLSQQISEDNSNEPDRFLNEMEQEDAVFDCELAKLSEYSDADVEEERALDKNDPLCAGVSDSAKNQVKLFCFNFAKYQSCPDKLCRRDHSESVCREGIRVLMLQFSLSKFYPKNWPKLGTLSDLPADKRQPFVRLMEKDLVDQGINQLSQDFSKVILSKETVYSPPAKCPVSMIVQSDKSENSDWHFASISERGSNAISND